MNQEDAADVFQALANADRLEVIRALVVAGPGGMTAGDIAKAVKASPSRASFHLSNLAEAGVVLREREARSQRYRVDFGRLGSLLTFLMQDCCQGSAELRACCGLDCAPR